MRIIFLTDRFSPGTGGVERSAQLTAEALQALGHEIDVLTENVFGAPVSEILPSGVRIWRFTVPRVRPLTKLIYWKRLWSFRWLLREADVLHFHDFHTLLYWFGPLRLLIRRPVYAITFHGFEGWPIRRRHRLLRRLAAASTDVRFGVGEYLRHFYDHPIDDVFIGAPVHVRKSEENGEEKWNSPPGRGLSSEAVPAHFAFVGRLASDNGIVEALSALSRMALRLPAVCSVNIAGDGVLRTELHSLEHEKFHIRAYGSMKDPSPCTVDAACMIATGFLGILDAFAMRKPVIIPAFTPVKRRYVASIPCVEEMAWVAASPEQFAEFGRMLMAGELDSEVKVRAAGKFVSSCSWSNIALQHLQAYSNARNTQ